MSFLDIYALVFEYLWYSDYEW